MRSDPLLTQAELDFIQQLMSPAPCRRPPPSTAKPRPAIGEQFSQLLDRLGDHEQLSLDIRGEHEHLSFPVRLVKHGPRRTRLELGTPLIFEPGKVERPWRLPLPAPLTLLDGDARPCGLQVVELSSNGMLVQRLYPESPAKHQRAQLLLSRGRRVQLRAQLVRRISQARYAYQLQPVNPQDEQILRQYLFEQHSAQQQNTPPA